MPLDFMAHENAMQVRNWPDLNLMAHESMCSWPWKVKNMNLNKLLGTLSSRNVDGQSSSIFGSVLVIFWRLLGKCQITYRYLQKASSTLWPAPLKYVMSVFILSSEIFVVICTKVFQICTCIFHICHGVTWQLHSNQNNEQFIITVYTNTLPTPAH